MTAGIDTDIDVSGLNIPKDAQILTPQPGPQTEFLMNPADVIFFGGSAGGGKTYGLLLDPLYNIGNSRFGSVMFRRVTKHITAEGGLWDTALGLYTGIGGKPIQSPHYHFVFPQGSRVSFHHMEQEKNRFDWQGSQIPDLKFDEITHFTWKQFNYMLSRLRSTTGVRGTIKGTCNPDPDHWIRPWIDWWIGEDGLAIESRSGVIRYFIIVDDRPQWGDTPDELVARFPLLFRDNPDMKPKSFTFIRSSIYDNKILMKEDPNYLANLYALTRVERERLLGGNWNIRATAGTFFQRSDFGEPVEAAPADARRVRGWDLAATERKETREQKERKSDDPDWTAGARLSEKNGTYYVEHVERFRVEAPKVEARIKAIAESDKSEYGQVKIRLPQDPGQAGKAQARAFMMLLAGFVVRTVPVTGSKEHRANPFAAQVQAGNVRLVRGKWNEAFLYELENFPEGTHDDQVDAVADAFDELTDGKRAGTW